MLRHLTPFARFAPALLAFTGFACGGGGGGGGAVNSETLNDGVYDVASFGYVDPKPATFHPLLGKPVFPLVRRDEVAAVLGAPEDSFMLDDATTYEAKGVTFPAIPASATAGMQLLNSTSGDVDGDGKPDLIVLGRLGVSSVGVLHVNILTIANSLWVLIGSFDVSAPGDHIENDFATVSAGDVDGDGRDEVIVAGVLDQYGWVRIYEDPIQGQGFGVLAKEIGVPPAQEVKAIAAQLDEDTEMELVVYVNPIDGLNAAYVLDDAAHEYVGMSSVPLFEDDKTISAQLIAYNRDDDAQDEIAVVKDRTDGKLEVAVYDDALATFNGIKTYAKVSSGTWSSTSPLTLRRAAAGDLDGDGVDELVVLIRTNSGSDYELKARVHWGNGTVTTKIFNFSTSVPKVWDLAFADRENQNEESRQLVVAYETVGNSSGDTNLRLNVQSFDSDPDSESHLKGVDVFGPFDLTAPAPIALVGEDFDNDGVRMRWKKVKFQQLPDPTLMVVLAAPPTKKGISQNYDASDVCYKTIQGSSFSYETTWGTSWSLSVGFDVEDPLGLNSLAGKATLKKGCEMTKSSESKVEKSVSFKGGYDQDVIIFQGTLHMIYVYEWVAAANPACIGTEVAINVPLDTKVYKWTRKFFQDTFGGNSPLPGDVFTHAIGNPSTYPTHNAAQDLLANHEGFEGDKVTLGQGKGSNGVGLSMEEVLGTEDKWTTEVEVEAEAKLAGLTFGAAFAITNEFVWKLETTKGTEYEGNFGDVLQSGDYFTWGYDVGIFTYRREDTDGNPFQVLDFWTDPWGSGY